MKKITSTIIAIIILINIGSTEALAELSAKNALDGDLSYNEGGVVYEQTAMEYALEQKKLGEAKKLWEKVKSSKAISVTCSLPVPFFEQENYYFCGPATVKQVYHYRWGNSNTQSYYANLLSTTTGGTDMTVIKNYLMNNVNSNYTYSSIGSRNNWELIIYYSLLDNRPPVLDIAPSTSGGFPYNSNGHFVNVSGAEFYDLGNNGNYVRITDPWTPGLGNRWYSSQNLYNANNAHFRQAIIW